MSNDSGESALAFTLEMADWRRQMVELYAIVRVMEDPESAWHYWRRTRDDAQAKLREVFGKRPAYADVPGLCKAATLEEIEAQGWSLNPGRYVGVAPGEEVSDEDFREQFETLSEELETLNAQARELEETIARNVAEILEA